MCNEDIHSYSFYSVKHAEEKSKLNHFYLVYLFTSSNINSCYTYIFTFLFIHIMLQDFHDFQIYYGNFCTVQNKYKQNKFIHIWIHIQWGPIFEFALRLKPLLWDCNGLEILKANPKDTHIRYLWRHHIRVQNSHILHIILYSATEKHRNPVDQHTSSFSWFKWSILKQF